MKYMIKVTSKGQVTLPAKMRKRAGIGTGSYIELRETEAGYELRKHVDDGCLREYMGILKKETGSDKIIRELRGE